MSKKTERSTRAEIGAKQRAYLRDTLKELGITATFLARQLGLSPSTFTRFIRLPDSSEKTLHPATLDKVEALRQTNSDSPIPTAAQGAWAQAREEATRVVVEGKAQDALARALAALIGDREGIEPWQLNTRALELEGFMPGDIVLVDGEAGALQVEVDAAELAARVGDVPDLSGNGFGLGRELFENFRQVAGRADQGAAVF